MEVQQSIDFEDIRITVPWGHVAGRWYGNRKVRPILAIHGWLDNLGSWDPLIPALPHHIGVLCIDLPGHGHSSRYPKGIIYHVLDYVHIIIRVIKEYKWTKISLMGHSMGAVICFLYASLYPRMVDLLINIDILEPVPRSNKFNMAIYAHHYEKALIEDERAENLTMQEPPSYTYDELERVMVRGTRGSLEPENCKYVLNRNIKNSEKYPNKYYFSRDPKTKYYIEFAATPGLNMELFKRMHNVPYMVIKANGSPMMGPNADAVIKAYREINPRFECHEIDGTHHVHINNYQEVAALVSPFINRYRPMTLDSWTMEQNGSGPDGEFTAARSRSKL